MDAVALLRMVSEETRHALLDQLRKGERTVSQLVDALADEQSNVSHHLGTMRDAGLVLCRRDGRKQVYRLADNELGRILQQVEDLAARLEQLAYTSSLGLPVDAAFHGYG
jgi:DNA-binding transcriptional ArsR family regulator